ncbi:integrase core domain-containing protein [Salipiger bermudensis]|uniref:integrase core domain-containing protein n=1 Tax=Salipiger bermudensis TaxID=344736 RepID=UPI00399085F0
MGLLLARSIIPLLRGKSTYLGCSDFPGHLSFAWTDRLRRSSVRISMDGKDRFLDNIFIERFWRSPKYECVFLHAWETGFKTKAAIRKWMSFYNHQRPHSALGGQPPALVYWQRNDNNQPDQQVQRVA